MTEQEINAQLYRPIKSGDKYDYLIPSSNCKSVKLASGNTKIALREMRKWAKKYSFHVRKLAPEFIGNTLDETINNIQYFLYNHLQYKIDGVEQNLKSPACAWATKEQGTDCKSYSIFASAILLELGIKHHLRRIKQEAVPDAYTHVYVAIPYDQDKPKLNNNAVFGKDYTIIDGTIEKNIELPFLKKDDLYMEPSLPINGLAAPSNGLGCSCENGHEARPFGLFMGAADKSDDNSFVKDILNGIVKDLPNLAADIFDSGFSCINSTYTPSIVKSRIKNQLEPFFSKLLSEVDLSQPQEAIEQLQTIIKFAKAGQQATLSTRAESKWKNCSKESLKMFSDWYKEIYEQTKLALDELVYQMKNIGYKISSSTQTFETRLWDIGDKPDTYNGDVGLNVYGANYDAIPSFSIPIYTVLETPSWSNEDVLQPIDGIGKNTSASTSQASFGGVGALLIGAAVIYGVYNYANKNKK